MPIELIPDEPQQPPNTSAIDFGNNLPDDAGGFLASVSEPVAESSPFETTDDAYVEKQTRRKRVNMSKKMKKSMDKFKKKTATLPIAWFHQQAVASGHPEWDLDDDEKDLLIDSIDTVFEVLDIEVQIEPLVATLNSIWWVLGYPLCVFAFLFLSKKSLADQQPSIEEQP